MISTFGKTIVALTSIGYAPRALVAPEQLSMPAMRKLWKDPKNTLVFSFFRGQKEYRVVHILFDHPLDFDKCSKRRVTVPFESLLLPIVHVDDLILLKRNTNREQDISDIRLLEQYVKEA